MVLRFGLRHQAGEHRPLARPQPDFGCVFAAGDDGDAVYRARAQQLELGVHFERHFVRSVNPRRDLQHQSKILEGERRRRSVNLPARCGAGSASDVGVGHERVFVPDVQSGRLAFQRHQFRTQHRIRAGFGDIREKLRAGHAQPKQRCAAAERQERGKSGRNRAAQIIPGHKADQRKRCWRVEAVVQVRCYDRWSRCRHQSPLGRAGAAGLRKFFRPAGLW